MAGLVLEICNNSFATITLESARKLYLEEPTGCAARGVRGAVAMATRSQQYLESDARFSALPLGLAALFLLAPFTEQTRALSALVYFRNPALQQRKGRAERVLTERRC